MRSGIADSSQVDMILPNFPFRVEFEVTTWCNLDCVYCYAKPFSSLFPPAETIKEFMKKTKEQASPFEVVVVGGEPFGRKDIVDLLEFGFDLFQSPIGASTNGTLISSLSEDKLYRLKRLYGSHAGAGLQVSFDSMNPVINNRTRGMAEQTIEGLNTLETYGIYFSIGLIPTKSNVNDVVLTVEHLLKNYSCLQALNLEPLQPTFMTGAKGYNELRISHNENVEIHQRVSELINSLKRNDVKVVGALDCSALKSEQVPLVDSYKFKTCTAGLLRAAVFVNGDVTPCTMLRNVVIGNLRRESWKEIWSKSKERFLGLSYAGGQCFTVNRFGDSPIFDPCLVEALTV